MAARHAAPVLAFERTAGDEFQGLLDDPAATVEIVLDLVRDGCWSIGIGVGAVELPLPLSTRAARGPAFTHARDAVGSAKRQPQGVAVRGVQQAEVADVEAMLVLLATVIQRRSQAAWQAVDLVESGLTLTDVAAKLGVSRQAIGQRLAAANWHQESSARPACARLLARADPAARARPGERFPRSFTAQR